MLSCLPTLAGVFDGSQYRLYVDGVLDASTANTYAPATGTANLAIGRDTTGSYQYFAGLIDELRISNAAIYTSSFTPAQHLTATGSTKGLWKFDSQSPNDSSGNSNNGTLQNGAGWRRIGFSKAPTFLCPAKDIEGGV